MNRQEGYPLEKFQGLHIGRKKPQKIIQRPKSGCRKKIKTLFILLLGSKLTSTVYSITHPNKATKIYCSNKN